MSNRTRGPRRERFLSTGELLISHNHLAILHGLYDRPRGTARSTSDLVAAAAPYLKLFGSTISALNVSVRAWHMHSSWASTRKPGPRRTWKLEERGYAIVRGEVPIRILGFGAYRSLAEVRDAIRIVKLAPRIDAKWSAAIQDPAFAELAQSVIELVRVWSIRNAPPPNMMAAQRRLFYRQRLWHWLRLYALRHRELPTGKWNTGPQHRDRDTTIDFDALRQRHGAR